MLLTTLRTFLLLHLAAASPVAIFQLGNAPRDVINPHITSPNETTVWTVGSTETITWDTSQITSMTQMGMAVLGFLEGNDDNEHLMLDNPLASSVSLVKGSIQITVPDVPPRNSYIVVLFGDSGNASPKFAIQGGSGTATPVPGASPTPSSADPLSQTLTTIHGSGTSTSQSVVTTVTATATTTHTPNEPEMSGPTSSDHGGGSSSGSSEGGAAPPAQTAATTLVATGLPTTAPAGGANPSQASTQPAPASGGANQSGSAMNLAVPTALLILSSILATFF